MYTNNYKITTFKVARQKKNLILLTTSWKKNKQIRTTIRGEGWEWRVLLSKIILKQFVSWHLYLDFGLFDSNIHWWNDIGGPAITSRFVDSSMWSPLLMKEYREVECMCKCWDDMPPIISHLYKCCIDTKHPRNGDRKKSTNI